MVDIFRKVDTMSAMAETRSRRPRRRFTDEFKQQAVRLVLDEGKGRHRGRQGARSGTVGAGAVGQTGAGRSVEGRSGLTTAEREELARLRKENRILQEERDILQNETRALRPPRLVGLKLRGVRSDARGCGRSLSGDITSPLKNMVRGWPAHMSVVTPQGDPV